MQPTSIGAVDKRNEAPSIRERATRRSGVEPGFSLSSSLQGRSSRQGEITCRGDL